MARPSGRTRRAQALARPGPSRQPRLDYPRACLRREGGRATQTDRVLARRQLARADCAPGFRQRLPPGMLSRSELSRDAHHGFLVTVKLRQPGDGRREVVVALNLPETLGRTRN